MTEKGTGGVVVLQTCWSCQHFQFTEPDGPYSEMTPGTDWSMWCSKHMWSDGMKPLDPSDSEEAFGKCMEIGFTCPEYQRKVK